MGAAVGQLLITDPAGLTINGAGSSDVITLNPANGSPLPGVVHLNGTFTFNGFTGANPLAGTKLDLGQSTLYINYASGPTPAALIQQYLANGYNAGAWNGVATASTGVITSATAAAGPLNVFAVGYADSADAFVTGQPANTIEIRYTLMGDTNLDRVVNATDAVQMARNYNATGTPAWDRGNFNFDTTINMADASLLQKNWNASAVGAAQPASLAVLASPGASQQPAAPIPAATTTVSAPAQAPSTPPATLTLTQPANDTSIHPLKPTKRPAGRHQISTKHSKKRR
jgi:hypothetical protein